MKPHGITTVLRHPCQLIMEKSVLMTMPLSSAACYRRFTGTTGSCHSNASVISYRLGALDIVNLDIPFRASFVPYTPALHIALALLFDPVIVFLSIIGRTKDIYPLVDIYWHLNHQLVVSDNTQ